MVILADCPGVREMNCGEADIRKSGSEPVVTVIWQTAEACPEIALTKKLPPDISGMVTCTFQVPPPAVWFSVMISPALGPESH